MNNSLASDVCRMSRCRHVWRSAVLCILWALGGCYYLQSPVAPIPHEKVYAREGKQSKDLLVLLPGMGDYASAYRKRGFIQRLQGSGKELDIISVNAHFKYYQTKTFHQRLREDVIIPARAAGYERIHLGGISLGGFGSLIFLREQPELVDTVIAFAPYMGENEHYANYREALHSGQGILEESNVWPWLYAEAQKSQGEETVLQKIYLAYGAQDSFAQDNARLAKLLPDNHSIVIDGGHDWPTWLSLWDQWLQSGDLPF